MLPLEQDVIFSTGSINVWNNFPELVEVQSIDTVKNLLDQYYFNQTDVCI